MASQQGVEGCSGGSHGLLAVEPRKGLALLEVSDDTVSGEPQRADVGRCVFDGIALGPGVYVDAADRRIRVREAHLPLVAERVKGVFLRDLHREDLGASVGVVSAARVEAGEVRFTGDVRLAPYVELIRHFWPHIRFSLGFRYDPARLMANDDGTFDLPADFLIDHLALVPQGQYSNARLVRLLNQARGLSPPPAPSPASPRSKTMSDDNTELTQLRQQRDDALKAAEQSKTALDQARGEVDKARADLEAANRLAEAARLELGQGKNRLAAEVMKLELGAGKDFDLDQRKSELTGLDLAALDRLRGELRLSAVAAEGDEVEAPGPVTTRTDGAPEAGAPPAKGQALDLAALGLNDALRLAFRQGVF